MKKPLLIATLGYPGSGKTYFSENLAKKENFFHLNSDKTRFKLFPNPKFIPEENKVLFSNMDNLAYDLLKKGISVVYDANFTKRIYRKRLKEIAQESSADYYLVWIKSGEETALERLEERAKITDKEKKLMYRPIDQSVFHQLKDEIEEPMDDEECIEIDGHQSFPEQYKVFLNVIKYAK